MLTYTFEKESKTPLYERLYAKIRDDITSGKIKAGEKLPSKRTLSEHLGLAKTTVEAAYYQLIAEGYVRSEERRGYYAEKTASVPAVRPKTEDETPLRRFDVDIESNGVGLELFPFSTWSRLMREVTLNYSRELLSAVPYNGAETLRKAICSYLAENRGMAVSASQAVVGAGTENLYGLITQLFGFDKRYAVENPSYWKIYKAYKARGADCVFVGMDAQGIKTDELEKSGAQIVHISPAHHFPTGTVTSPKRRAELLEWAGARPDRYIIEDEYDEEFRFTGKAPPPMQPYDANGKVVYMNTFSKTIAPSIRIGYMILPPELARLFKEKLGFYSCAVAAFEQYTLAKFISDGYFERHIRRMKRYYKLLREDVINAVKSSPIADRAEIIEPNSGLHFLLKLKTEKSDAELKKACAEKGIKIAFLSEYYAGAESEKSLALINYSGVSLADFKKALERLEEQI